MCRFEERKTESSRATEGIFYVYSAGIPFHSPFRAEIKGGRYDDVVKSSRMIEVKRDKKIKRRGKEQAGRRKAVSDIFAKCNLSVRSLKYKLYNTTTIESFKGFETSKATANSS